MRAAGARPHEQSDARELVGSRASPPLRPGAHGSVRVRGATPANLRLAGAWQPASEKCDGSAARVMSV